MFLSRGPDLRHGFTEYGTQLLDRDLENMRDLSRLCATQKLMQNNLVNRTRHGYIRPTKIDDDSRIRNDVISR